MKTLLKSLLAAGLMLAFSSSFAQTKEENHTKLIEHYKKAKESLTKFKTGELKDKESKKKSAEEAGKSLANAKAQYNALKASIPAKYSAVAAPHYAAIEKYHTEADKDAGNLNAELAKADSNDEKSKEYSEAFYTDLTNAEAEHAKLKSDISFQ